MNPDIKKRWVEALRSGKYKQGRIRLRNRYGDFCCLGVLCDTLNPSAWKEDLRGDFSFDGEAVHLPHFLSRSVEMDTDIQTDLIEMNDSDGFSFLQIADYIEREL